MPSYTKEQQLSRPPKTAQTKADKRRVYAEVTEGARSKTGVLICSVCTKPIAEGQAARHHKVFRSQGGKTTKNNLEVLCRTCHSAKHGIHETSTA